MFQHHGAYGSGDMMGTHHDMDGDIAGHEIGVSIELISWLVSGIRSQKDET